MNTDIVNIEGMDVAAVFAALYNNAEARGFGALEYDPAKLSRKECEEAIREKRTLMTAYPDIDFEFDYFKGRCMKVAFKKDATVDVRLYDREYGAGTAKRIIDALRAGMAKAAKDKEVK